MIAYTITEQGKVWMINEADGATIPQWCYEKDGYFVVDELPDNIQDMLNEEAQEQKKKKALIALQSLCDTKSIQAKTFIAGKDVTAEQLARYEEKYQIATEYKANGSYIDVLKLEADLQELSVDELADLIIAKGQAYKQALINFNAKIEAFRIKVAGLIESGEIDKANEVITKAKKLGAETTDEDIKKLFI